MRARHSHLCFPQATNTTNSQHRRRKVSRLLLLEETHHNREHSIDDAAVLPDEIRGSERVHLDRSLPAGMPLHQISQERRRTMEERDVVWMTANSSLVESDYRVDHCFGRGVC